MARPLSEEKRDAILAAAIELIATQGHGAPTARIAQAAGVSEGSLFTYFASKDELLNQVFLALETELSEALFVSYPSQLGVRERTRHIWNAYIDWGAAHPAKQRAMQRLKVSDRIRSDCKHSAEALFSDISKMFEKDLASHLNAALTPDYVRRAMAALSEMTLEMIALDPGKSVELKHEGFNVFWKGVAR